MPMDKEIPAQGTLDAGFRSIRKPADVMYALITLEIDSGESQDIEMLDIKEFKMALMDAMKSMHGEMGLAIPVDILRYDQDLQRAIIRFPPRNYVALRGALTCYGKYRLNGDSQCAFRFIKIAHSLLSISSAL